MTSSAAAVQFGFVMPAEKQGTGDWTTYVHDIQAALRLISGYFDSAWMVDHLMFEDTDVPESFTALSYRAALHPDLHFGHTVLSSNSVSSASCWTAAAFPG
jgi:alkanesulfonate monooxygenase SsuD/methylene tetrahydromethanopterin reductase-like flavin-dependent oxidoreductase (luciferase family)